MGEEPGGHVGVEGVGGDEDVAVGAAADVDPAFVRGGDGVVQAAGGAEGDERVVVAMGDEGGAGDAGGEGGGLDAVQRDAALPLEERPQGGVKGRAEPAAEELAALPLDDGGELVKTGDDDEGVPLIRVRRRGVDGDGTAHGHAPESGGARGEGENGCGFLEGFQGKGGFLWAEGGDGAGVVAMTGEVQQEAAETGGGETDGDGEVVLFATTAAMKENEGGAVFTADCRERDAARLKLGAEEGAALVEAAAGIGTAEQGGCAAADGEGFNGDAVRGGGLEDDVVVVLKGAAAGPGDFTGGEPGADEPKGEADEGEPDKKTPATAFEARCGRGHV